MATVQLSYTAAQIDAAIAKVNSFVTTISGSIVQLYDGSTAIYPRTKAESVFFDNDTSKTLNEVVEDLQANPGAYDISAANGGTPYVDLAAALGTNGANVPADVRRGGMSIKFIQGSVPNSDNNYVQFRYMLTDVTTAATFTNVSNWQGVDKEPTDNSHNLVESGGVKRILNDIDEKTDSIKRSYTSDTSEESIIIADNNGSSVVEVTPEGVDAKNLKSNGANVLTEDDERITDLQDKTEDIETAYASNNDEEVIVKNSNFDTICKVNNNGIYAKEFYNLNGEPIGAQGNKYIYIATNGNDSNNGDVSHPKLSINNALSAGYTNFIINEGIYTQDINLQLANSDVVIKGATGKKVIFKKADTLMLNDGSETLVSGYSNVYSKSGLSSMAGYGGNWIFFDDLDDALTAISHAEAHPCQRGKLYRNDCTKLYKTTASTLSDALDEIENADTNVYKWFFDSGTNTLYFNRKSSTSTYPIYKSSGSSFLTPKDNLSILLDNIEFRYAPVSFIKMNYCEAINCSSKYGGGSGSFVYNNAISVKFVNCEASSCQNGEYGDGFNGHGANQTDIFAKRCQAVLINCWSHDNNDDGFSDHEFSESLVIGGLYEYNGKAGITPSYGAHCVCHNVYSRHNYAGFYYIGTALDEGNGGQIECHNCISEQNDRGGHETGFYIDGTRNRMLLFDCLALHEQTAYGSGAYAYIDLFDCRYIDCVTTTSFDVTSYSHINNSNKIS